MQELLRDNSEFRAILVEEDGYFIFHENSQDERTRDLVNRLAPKSQERFDSA